MPLDNRNPEPGTVLVARYKKQERTCEVVQTDDGIRYRLDDKTEHRSPSSAGKAAMGGIACNGWRFWSLQGDLKPAEAKKEKDGAPKKAAKAPAKKGAKKGKPTKGGKKRAARMASGGSYGCVACGQEFPTMKAATQHALTHTAS